ncbi:MAG: DUF6612 family protein [Bilifractor sp.]|jgi:hypothetical protein
MKKNFKTKLTASALAVIIGASLAACSGGATKATPESLAKSAVTSMKKAESVSGKINMDFSGSISVTGSSSTLDLEMTSDLDLEETFDPFVMHMNGDMNITASGQDQSLNIEQYTEKDNDKLVSYQTVDDGDTWTKTSADMSDEDGSFSGSSIFNSIANGDLDADLEEDTEEVEGEECYVIDTEITGDMITEILDSTGMGDSLGDLDTSDLEDESADTTLYISKKSSRPKKMTCDMADLGSALISSALEATGASDTADVNIDKFTAEYVFDEFDSVDEIEIPDEAKDAEESTSASGLFNSSGTGSTSSSSDLGTSASTATATPTATPTPTATATPAASGQNSTTAPVTGSTDWTSLSFTLDGKNYQIPFAYSTLQSDWAFNMADYGYTNGYATNPGDKQYCTIDVTNSKYDMDFKIGTVNVSNAVQDITQNSIWAVNMSIEWANTWPSLQLPGGITWGSTYDQVIAAYGTPEDEPYRSDELGYYSLSYNNNYQQRMKLIVYDDGGLKGVTLENYAL